MCFFLFDHALVGCILLLCLFCLSVIVCFVCLCFVFVFVVVVFNRFVAFCCYVSVGV